MPGSKCRHRLNPHASSDKKVNEYLEKTKFCTDIKYTCQWNFIVAQIQMPLKTFAVPLNQYLVHFLCS